MSTFCELAHMVDATEDVGSVGGGRCEWNTRVVWGLP